MMDANARDPSCSPLIHEVRLHFHVFCTFPSFSCALGTVALTRTGMLRVLALAVLHICIVNVVSFSLCPIRAACGTTSAIKGNSFPKSG